MLFPLTNGYAAEVDSADFKWLLAWKWYARKGRSTMYAARCEWINGHNRVIYMHRELIGAKPGYEVDHRDGNGLNNMRHNLRIATHQQNLCNRTAQKNNSSGVKGVYATKSGKFKALLQVNRKQIYVGTFADKNTAVAARLEAARQYHGEFASS